MQDESETIKTMPSGIKHLRRTNTGMAVAIEHAIIFQKTLGDKVARAFLLEKNIPRELVNRVLSGCKQRRQSQTNCSY
jgi:hypothetical protein